MKPVRIVGLIGGMSWESTLTYYKVLNEEIRDRLGGLHSAKCIVYSLDFHEIEKFQSQNEWQKSGKVLLDAALNLEKAGAECVMICTNTMHKVADMITASLKIPFIHIADVTAQALKQNGSKKALLLGTKYTMTESFYKDKISKNSIEVVVPNKSDTDFINSVIFNELCIGNIKQSSKIEFIKIINESKKLGVDSVILGCTEIGLLIKDDDCDIKIFDTTLLHAKAAADFSIN